MASDLMPSALELLDGRRSARSDGGEAGPALLVGVDGIAEQVEWQCAELGRLLARSAASKPAC